ncbi:hypothetical protein DPEC_G00302720 [Dallia pectoralis]|uniref:Uncharacterized protein n=1 Tax=Dallia pectoralis TaxID=75939 RepID=A0ACC2FH99_DALPE|nr:hypothetical protein DPEC_G00302720 [Dallia pectoralis]
MATERRFRQCASPCNRFLTGRDTHVLCVVCLGEEHAQLALEEASCKHCDRLAIRTLRSRLALFQESGSVRVPRGSGPAAAEARRRLTSWGSQADLACGSETASAISRSSSARASASARGPEAPARVSSALGEAPFSQPSSSEEMEVENLEAEAELLVQSPANEELLEVLTRAVGKLNIEWPADRQESASTSKLNERFLPSRALPPRRGLPFSYVL